MLVVNHWIVERIFIAIISFLQIVNVESVEPNYQLDTELDRNTESMRSVWCVILFNG